MSKDTTFVRGTIVQADYLNKDQEANTGLVWGVRLAQNSSNSVETNVVGDPTDSHGSMIVGGKVAYKNGASVAASASGSAGTRDIYASSTVSQLPDYSVEVLETSQTPASAYYRKIGSASWDGSVLSDITLENGVQADANQYNQFTFQTISNSTSDVALTLSGYSTQNNASSKLLSVGSDNGGGYVERMSLRGNGQAAFQPASSTTSILTGQQYGDAVARYSVRADGQLGWGSGTLAQDVFLMRGSAGVLMVTDGTVGGNGIVDTVAIQNSKTGGAAYNGAGMVNVLDDLNIQTGSVLRYNGTQFGSSHLSDAATVAHLTGIETFTGAKTFSAVQTFTNNTVHSGANGYLERSGTSGSSATEVLLQSKESSDANARFASRVNGKLEWGDGTLARDVEISRTAANELSMGSGDYIKQSYAPTASEPNVLVNRATLDAALTSGAASSSFTFFMA